MLVGNVHLTSGPNRHANIAGVWGPERLHGERHPLASHVGETSVAFDETSSIWNALVMKVATRLPNLARSGTAIPSGTLGGVTQSKWPIDREKFNRLYRRSQ